MMAKYKITFDFIVNDIDSDGKWRSDYLDNNDKGFTRDEAEHIAQELKAMSFPYQNRNVIVIEM